MAKLSTPQKINPFATLPKNVHPFELIDYDLLKFWFDLADYTPSPRAEKVHRMLIEPRYTKEHTPTPTIVILGGGEQSGKSWTGGHHVYAMHPFGQIFWIVGATYQDSRKEFQYMVEAGVKSGAIDPANYSMPNEGPCVAVFNNGCKVRTLSSDDTTSLASESPDGVLMVEAGRQSYQAFRTLLSRVQHHLGWFLVSGTFEQMKGRWFPDLWKMCSTDNDYQATSISLRTYDNPTTFPDGDNDPRILAIKKTLSDEEFSERFLGTPRSTLGVVFPEFRRTSHVRDVDEDPTESYQLWVDPGWSPSAYACLWVQKVGEQIRILDEVYEHNRTNKEICEMIINDKRVAKLSGIVIDVASQAHAGAQDPALDTWRSMFSGRNVPIKGRFVRISDGIQRTHDKLRINPLTGEPYMIIHPRCESTIWELEEGYRFHVRKSGDFGQGANLPEDKNNHAAKAIAYGLINEFGSSEGMTFQPLKPTRRKMSYD